MKTLATAVLLLLSLLPLSSLYAQEKAERVEPTNKTPLGKVFEWTTAQNKPYWYRLPKSLDANKPSNLLIMMHGTGMKWGWAFWNYSIADGDFRKNDIVIAPEGMTPGGGDTFNFVQGKPDGEQIAGLIELFKKRFSINNVYLYGHSQGAFFCYWMAGEYPELVNGIVAHAGNVLDVKFPKLAKENQAIGILHGRADAVVPVDCALRTEEIYKKEGYKKLKLYIVEGLNEQTGHWPLPKQVSEMLDWLDQSCARSMQASIDAALYELSKKDPNWGAVSESIEKAGVLAKSDKSTNKVELDEKLKALQQFIGEIQGAHVRFLTQDPSFTNSKLGFNPWAVHFRIANANFKSSPVWQAGLKNLPKQAEAQQKRIEASSRDLLAPKKSTFKESIKVLEECILAPSYLQLLQQMNQFANKPEEKIAEGDLAKFKGMIAERKEIEEAGLKSSREASQDLLAQFLEKHKTWIPSPEKKD